MFFHKLNKDDYDFFLSTMEEVTSVPEYSKLNAYIQHGDTTCYAHSVDVAYHSYVFAKKMRFRIDYRSLIRGALLHDFFLYDWHTPDANRKLHGFSHPQTAYDNAIKFYEINAVERDIILTHMWPLTLTKMPKHKESLLVCMVDKYRSLKETAGCVAHGLKQLLRRKLSMPSKQPL